MTIKNSEIDYGGFIPFRKRDLWQCFGSQVDSPDTLQAITLRLDFCLVGWAYWVSLVQKGKGPDGDSCHPTLESYSPKGDSNTEKKKGGDESRPC